MRRAFASAIGAALAVVCLGMIVLNAQEETAEEQIRGLLDMLGVQETMTEDALKARVEEIGGLKLIRPLQIRFMTKEQLKQYLEQVFDDEYPASEAVGESELLKFLGLIPADYDLRAERAQLLYENVAGFYDERSPSKSLYAVSSSSQLDFLNAFILSHEIRHAIQDQHFDLEHKLPDLSDFDDRRLAALGAYEGDATFVMLRFAGVDSLGAQNTELGDDVGELLGGIPLDLGAMIQSAATLTGGRYAAAPEVIQRQLLLPYIEGDRFIEAAYNRGGQSEVNRVLARPPATSEQLLHPDKYFGRDDPQDVHFNLSSRLPGQTLVFEGVLGEFYMRSLFPADQDGVASAGWDGDFYQMYRDSSGRRTLVWKQAWDRTADAAEFCDAWRMRCGGNLAAHGAMLDGRDTDAVRIRIVKDGATTTVVKSESPDTIAELTVER
ncbi:MAG: hypothetical protein AB1714_26655 [Acidobacteriota bacterium]